MADGIVLHPVSLVQEARLLAEEAASYGAPRPSPMEFPIAIRICLKMRGWLRPAISALELH
jgi:hypothetical protein